MCIFQLDSDFDSFPPHPHQKILKKIEIFPFKCLIQNAKDSIKKSFKLQLLGLGTVVEKKSFKGGALVHLACAVSVCLFSSFLFRRSQNILLDSDCP